MTEGARPIRFLFLVLPASLPFYLLDLLAPAQALAVTAPLIAVVIAMRIAWPSGWIWRFTFFAIA